MQNLNKYTKAELIRKLKNTKLEIIEPNSATKFIDLLMTYKSLILKLTLITFIIKWIKKYSLVAKLWHLFSVIGSTLLGLSMIDIYSLDFINWVKDTNIYKWYSELFNKTIVENKTEIIEPSSNMRSSDKNSTTNETRNERDYEIMRKIKEVINPTDENQDPVINQDEIMEEDIPFYKNKYFIIGAISVTAIVSWYYLDEIKTGYGAIIDYLSSFRSSPPDDPTGSDSSGNTISNTMDNGSKLNVQDRIKQFFKDPDDNIPDDAKSEIEIIDNTQPSSSKLDKGKGVLTSPSLENLNNQAEERWSEGSSSPKSDTSSTTITPSKILESTIVSTSSIEGVDYISRNWNLMFSTNVRDKIRIIENGINSNLELTLSRRDLLAKHLGELMAEYDVQTIVFNRNSNNFSNHDLINIKESFYQFRSWIKKYSEIILVESNKSIDIGNINDDPKMIFDNI